MGAYLVQKFGCDCLGVWGTLGHNCPTCPDPPHDALNHPLELSTRPCVLSNGPCPKCKRCVKPHWIWRGKCRAYWGMHPLQWCTQPYPLQMLEGKKRHKLIKNAMTRTPDDEGKRLNPWSKVVQEDNNSASNFLYHNYTTLLVSTWLVNQPPFNRFVLMLKCLNSICNKMAVVM